MKEIYLERNKLRDASSKLRTAKFDPEFKNNFDKVEKEQDKVYKKFVFYDKFIKARNKIDKK